MEAGRGGGRGGGGVGVAKLNLGQNDEMVSNDRLLNKVIILFLTELDVDNLYKGRNSCCHPSARSAY